MGVDSRRTSADPQPACLLGLVTGFEPRLWQHNAAMGSRLIVLHPGDLSDLLRPSFPDAACRDHIDLFDAAAGRPNRLEVASAREIAPLTLRRVDV